VQIFSVVLRVHRQRFALMQAKRCGGSGVGRGGGEGCVGRGPACCTQREKFPARNGACSVAARWSDAADQAKTCDRATSSPVRPSLPKKKKCQSWWSPAGKPS
jgi:hypothetical protein